ncbi:MAG TPA: hypothetical protein V6C85_17640 [Allocoleopsis sp.]
MYSTEAIHRIVGALLLCALTDVSPPIEQGYKAMTLPIRKNIKNLNLA